MEYLKMMKKNKKKYKNALSRISTLYNELKDVFDFEMKYDIIKGNLDKEINDLKSKDFNQFINENKNYESILSLRFESYKARVNEFKDNIFKDEYYNPLESLNALEINNPNKVIESWKMDYTLIEKFLREHGFYK